MGVLDGLLGQVLGGAMSRSAQDEALRSRGGMPGGPGGLGEIFGGGAGGGLGGAAAGAGLIAVLLQVLQQNGGLGRVLSQFQQAGYGPQADSWVSTGRNAPIDGDILSQVLGSGQIDEIAQRLGMSRRDAADQMATALPDVVDRMTPRGAVPGDSEDLVNRALEILQRGAR
jgi:uncharacterized protein YidB (DUF937 family)